MSYGGYLTTRVRDHHRRLIDGGDVLLPDAQSVGTVCKPNQLKAVAQLHGVFCGRRRGKNSLVTLSERRFSALRFSITRLTVTAVALHSVKFSSARKDDAAAAD